MRELNQRWRGEGRPTDVLAFPAAQDGVAVPEPTGSAQPAHPFLGDIALNLVAVERQAAEEMPQRLARLWLGREQPQPGGGWGPLEEATFLLVHGVLHLLGHDHGEPAAEAAMVAEEARLMAPFLRPPWRR